MDYSEMLLGKSIRDLNYQDLKRYFKKPKEETDKIEYKSYHLNESINNQYKAIYEAICALLNSEGGVIIWGAPEGKNIEGKKEKIFSGELTLIDSTIEKDALINRISDSITPLPTGIQVKILTHKKSYIVVIEVPKSEYAPHQTGNIFYMRLDGQTRKAPYHYVEALFKQIRHPNLGGYIKLVDFPNKSNQRDYMLKIQVALFNHSYLQNEELVTVRLISGTGKFLFDSALYDSIFHHRVELLHYGTPEYLDVSILYSDISLQKHDYEDRLILFFGGKYSPMKKSEYKLAIGNFNPILKNLKDIIIEFKENELMVDIGKEKGSEDEKVEIWRNG